MNLKTVITDDKSKTLLNEEIGEHYHSSFGAITESQHIFIDAALKYQDHQKKHDSLEILEIGFGSGLNAFMTLDYINNHDLKINYTGIEAYPITKDQAVSLNFSEQLNMEENVFLKLHETSPILEITNNFTLNKIIGKLEDLILPESKFDIVYFDAFSPDVQPELWTEDIFKKIFNSMSNQSVLTTYSCKGIVKRAMKAAGFSLEKLPGPPGKREFLRATKSFDKGVPGSEF